MKLNEFQVEAVNHINGPCLVTSVPGSGKTFVLVERVVSLIHGGVPQKNILSLTFTNKASKEMSERICRRLEVKSLDFFCGTFHSLCANLLRKYGYLLGYENFNILDDTDQLDLIKQIARQKEVEIEKPDAYNIAYCVNFQRDQMEDFQWVRDRLRNALFEEIAEEYLMRCKNNMLIDFSGLIYETIQIIENNQEVREKLQNLFKYILVDETQDTNASQFHLVNLLAAKWRNIMIIGDINQSIYLFRGAKYQNITDFLSMYPDCKLINLGKNYRSTPQIIKVADKLIRYNNSFMGGEFTTDNHNGEPVRCFQMQDQNTEAEWVSSKIKRLINEGGWDAHEIAVLYRMNKMSEPIEQALAVNGISYEVIGSWSFYDRRESKDCLSMLKFLANPKDGVAFHRVCGIIPGLGDVSVGKIENHAKKTNVNLIEACEDFAEHGKTNSIRNACSKIVKIYKNTKYNFKQPSQCISKLIAGFEYEDFLHHNYKEDAQERVENIKQVVDACSNFNDQENGVHKYLQQIALVTTEKEKEGSKVSLMSLHAAKGLEFSIVFIIGAENTILPHSKCVVDNPLEGMDEERRLCYVGITRAKKILYITFCKMRKSFGKYGNMITKKAIPSQFLFEAGILKEGSED